MGTDYLVWSNEHRAWWRPGRQGYTGHLNLAGRYSREDALAICAGAIPGSRTVLNELPVPVADVEAMLAAYSTDRGEAWR